MTFDISNVFWVESSTKGIFPSLYNNWCFLLNSSINLFELKAGIDKFTNPNDESLYVVSVDPTKISGLTRWGIKTAGGDEAEKFLDNGYSFTIYKGNVNGVGNINTQKDAWLNQFSDYEFFANRILQNGGVEFKVAKITPKNDN